MYMYLKGLFHNRLFDKKKNIAIYSSHSWDKNFFSTIKQFILIQKTDNVMNGAIFNMHLKFTNNHILKNIFNYGYSF